MSKRHNRLHQKTSEKFVTFISWVGIGIVFTFLFWTFAMVVLQAIGALQK